MQVVQDFARRQGCSTQHWQTPDWNHAAMRFYARLGATALVKRRYTLALDEVVTAVLEFLDKNGL